MNDLFSSAAKKSADYSAKDIEVLEGLEPVRRRPGMYIGGTDERAMHHLVAEVLDNAMDEAVAGHVNRRGTKVRFHADPEVFGKEARFQPARLYRMARSKAYLYRGVEIRWRCDPALIGKSEETPAEAVLHFPGGLGDFLAASLE